jgi:dihydrofolate reductase
VPKLRVHNFTISLDGFAAGPHQRADAPLGEGGSTLHGWMFATRSGHAMQGLEGGQEGLDDDVAAAGDAGIGATIMGRNMFGPVRGAWADESWTGWWGDNPPYHHDVFVLTHYPRPSLSMLGGTTFHFVDDAPKAVLAQAFDAADGQDVRLGGGAATIQQFLRAGLVDDLHIVIVPMLLGSGERLFDNLASLQDGYACRELVSSPSATHAHITRGP